MVPCPRWTCRVRVGKRRERGNQGGVWIKSTQKTHPRLPPVDSRLLLTGSADSSAKLWDVKTGACLFTWSYDAPCKAVAFSLGEDLVATSTDPFMERKPAIRIYRLNRDDPAAQSTEPLVTLTGFAGRTNRVLFHDLNAHLLSAGEDGVLRRWDVETGALLDEARLHEGAITDVQVSADGTHLVTSSLDTKAKLVDAVSFDVLKTYKTSTNANGAAISPAFNHVLIGGGQEAAQVTTTSARAGHFEARFFHKLYEEEFGNVKGAFGPLNSVAFAPDGRGFATGGEDGYVRLYHFDNSFFSQSSKDAV